jgi:hypothetical protein
MSLPSEGYPKNARVVQHTRINQWNLSYQDTENRKKKHVIISIGT